jgi:hypothetical protein
MILYTSVILYLLLGIFLETIPFWYATLTIYVIFKWLFNYRKCTISYLEIKLRRVPKTNGLLYNYLESLVDLRDDSELVGLLMIYMTLVLFKYRILQNLHTKIK